MTLLEPLLHPPCTLPRLVAGATSEDLQLALETAGCAIVERALPRDLLDLVNEELDPWFDEAPCGEGYFFGLRTKRFSGLFAKSPTSMSLALHEPILTALEKTLLGDERCPHADCIQLNLTQAIAIGDDEPSQLLHRDDGLFPMPKTFELMANVMWALDDFTIDNGATRLAPGSHLWAREEIEQFEDEVESAVATAGSAIIWLGSLLHGGGQNRSGKTRRGAVMSYSLGWLAQAEKLLLSIDPALARTLPERLQRLIGYQVHRPNLGWVEGRDPLEWLRRQVTTLAPASDNLTPGQNAMMRQYLQAVGRI